MTAPPITRVAEAHPTDRAERIGRWLVDWVAQRLELPVERIDPRADVDVFALESTEVLLLRHDVHHEFGVQLAPGALWQAGTLHRLAGQLADQLAAVSVTAPR